MVLFNAATFISVISCVVLAWPTESFAQSKSKSKTARANARSAIAAKKKSHLSGALRYGLGIATIPQTATLKSTGNVKSESEVATEANGVILSVDYEQRLARWMVTGGAGIGVMGVRAKSLDPAVEYSFSKDTSLAVLVSGTIFYITAPAVRVGLGLKGFYSDYDLPVKSEGGNTYTFDYGNNLKSYANVELNWQFTKRILFSQSILSPLSKNSGTAWLLALKTSF